MCSSDPKISLESKIIDKIYLIITSIIACAAIIGIAIMLDAYHLREGWFDFIFMSVIYMALVSNRSYHIIKKLPRKLFPIYIIIFQQALVIMASFSIFYFKIIELPDDLKHGKLYIAGGVIFVLVVVTLVSYESILKAFKIIDDKSENDESDP